MLPFAHLIRDLCRSLRAPPLHCVFIVLFQSIVCHVVIFRAALPRTRSSGFSLSSSHARFASCRTRVFTRCLRTRREKTFRFRGSHGFAGSRAALCLVTSFALWVCAPRLTHLHHCTVLFAFFFSYFHTHRLKESLRVPLRLHCCTPPPPLRSLSAHGSSFTSLRFEVRLVAHLLARSAVALHSPLVHATSAFCRSASGFPLARHSSFCRLHLVFCGIFLSHTLYPHAPPLHYRWIVRRSLLHLAGSTSGSPLRLRVHSLTSL